MAETIVIVKRKKVVITFKHLSRPKQKHIVMPWRINCHIFTEKMFLFLTKVLLSSSGNLPVLFHKVFKLVFV